MRTEVVRRFLWTASLLIFACLLTLTVYIAQQASNLLLPLLGASVLVLAVAAGLTYRRVFARRAEQLRNYTERLLDPDIFDYELPTGDDELGELARSLRRTVPRIRALVENLKLEGARREAILASMVEGVLAVDRDLRVTFCNDSFAQTVGARIPVAPGTRLAELVRDPKLLEIVTTVLATSGRVEGRLTLTAASGHSFDVLAGPLEGPSTTAGALAIFHDVTELERLERVRKDFVANVSHELRTPLTAIHGYAETLLAGALEDEENKRKFVEIILAQAGRLTNIASDLLTLSELERGKTAPNQQVSVRAALESALRTVEANATARSVRLVRGKIDDVKVMTEQLRLEQVFVNLLDNAVKFNRPQGEVRVEVQSTGKSACITIVDTGIGIPSEDLPRVFERFYRVDKARSREMGGTGLGLAIVKHAVEQMGGTITVQSRLGEGTSFTVMIAAL
jgi:two-component system, OmpR family, phosphate regulon sensor histidine kinase PhoR